jgi:hypothetical protein
MKKIPISVIIITIFLFLFLLVFIASKATSSSDNENIKSLISREQKIIEYFFPINCIKEQNSLIFDTSFICNKSIYVLTGEFDESSLSIWDNGSLIYNKISDGPQGFVFYTNKNLVSQGFYKTFDIYPEIKIKNKAIDLSKLSQNPEKLIITLNNYNNSKIYYYSGKINPLKAPLPENSLNVKGINNVIDSLNKESLCKDILFKDFDFSEYGITKHIEFLYKDTNYKLFKLNPERLQDQWVYRLNPEKKYIFTYIKNLYSLEIKVNDTKESLSKNDSKGELEILELPKGSSDIYIKNKEEKLSEHTINSDFIDAIYAPYYMYNQFVYGKEKAYFESKNKINYKVCCFEI